MRIIEGTKNGKDIPQYKIGDRTRMDALRGIFLVLRTPRLWPMSVGPLLGAVVVYISLGIAGGYFLLPRIAEWLTRLPGGGFWSLLGEAAAIFIYLLLFPLFFIVFGSVFFGLVFESLSLAVERLVAPDETPQTVRLGMGTLFADTCRRLLVNGSLGICAVILGLFLGPLAAVPGVLAAAIIGTLDYSSPAYLRRGITLAPQANRLLKSPDSATVSFGLVAGLLTLVPLVGVLLMPGLIAGGTLLARRKEA
jgi:CysZ protein